MAVYTYVSNKRFGDNGTTLIVNDSTGTLRLVRIGYAVDISPATLTELQANYVFQAGGSQMAPVYTAGNNGSASKLSPVQYDPTTMEMVPTAAALNISGGSSALLPTSGQKDALQGSYGSPNISNRYMTETDPRIVALGTALPPRTGMWLDFFRLANDGSPVFSNYTQTTTRFKRVIVNIDQRSVLASLKAANAFVKVLAYQELIYDGALINSANGFQSDCTCAISREEITDVHTQDTTTDWYARDSSNGLVLNPFGSGGRLLRLDSPDVSSAISANILSRLKSGSIDYDGVFLDDVNFNIPTGGGAGNIAIPVTTDFGWYSRMLRPALASIYPALKAKGVEVSGNFGNAGEYFMVDLLPRFDNYLDEFWTRYGGGSWNGYWYHSMVLAEKAIAQGTAVLLGTQGSSNSDTTAMRSGLAAALMVTDAAKPELVSYGFTGIDHTNEKWDATFDYAIGAPTGARAWTGTAFASGLIRYFTNGVAVFHPQYNPGAPYGDGQIRGSNLVVSLTGGNYTGSGRTSVSSVTLTPGEGVVMVKG